MGQSFVRCRSARRTPVRRGCIVGDALTPQGTMDASTSSTAIHTLAYGIMTSSTTSTSSTAIGTTVTSWCPASDSSGRCDTCSWVTDEMDMRLHALRRVLVEWPSALLWTVDDYLISRHDALLILWGTQWQRIHERRIHLNLQREILTSRCRSVAGLRLRSARGSYLRLRRGGGIRVQRDTELTWRTFPMPTVDVVAGAEYLSRAHHEGVSQGDEVVVGGVQIPGREGIWVGWEEDKSNPLCVSPSVSLADSLRQEEERRTTEDRGCCQLSLPCPTLSCPPLPSTRLMYAVIDHGEAAVESPKSRTVSGECLRSLVLANRLCQSCTQPSTIIVLDGKPAWVSLDGARLVVWDPRFWYQARDRRTLDVAGMGWTFFLVPGDKVESLAYSDDRLFVMTFRTTKHSHYDHRCLWWLDISLHRPALHCDAHGLWHSIPLSF